MKHLTLLLLALITSLGLSAQLNNRTIKLSGSINDNYAIIMTLNINGEEVIGFYYYDKYKSKIVLEGNIQDNKLVLHESSGYESDFEVGFIGVLNEKSFAGVWKDNRNNKELDFNTLVYSDITTRKDTNILAIEGRFESIFNSDKYIGSVGLQHIEDNIFYFEISNGTEKGCVGYLKGLIELHGLSKGLYTGQGCDELHFSLLNNELTLVEKNCNCHGLNCPFEGKYKKKE